MDTNPPRPGVEDNTNKNMRQIDKQKAQTTKNVKGQHQKMKVIQEKPPFVIGIVHHHVGSPYKSENSCIGARTRSQKTNIQNTNRGLHRNPPTAKCRFEAGKSREKAVLAKGSISAPEPTQQSSKLCEEMKTERDPGKKEVLLKRNVNVSQSVTTIDSATKLTSESVAATNNGINEDKENCLKNEKIVNVAGYRDELDKVIKELESSCNEWTHLSPETSRIPEEIMELINVAIGQTQLLIKEKLQQYRGLINECASTNGQFKVTEDDLRGFWDMISIQVRNIQSKFQHLATLKQNDWKELERVVKTSVPKRKSVMKQSNIKKAPLRSSLREHIAAMRKMKKVVEEENRKPLLEENPLVSVCSGGTKSNIN